MYGEDEDLLMSQSSACLGVWEVFAGRISRSGRPLELAALSFALIRHCIVHDFVDAIQKLCNPTT